MRKQLNTYTFTYILVSGFRKNKNTQFVFYRGFLAPDLFRSTSLTSWGSNWVSKEAEFIKEFNLLDFSCCVLVKIEKSSKTSKIELNNDILGWFLEVCSIMAGKQWLKPRKLKFLINSALDTQFDPPSCETSGDVSSFTLCFEI